MKFCVMSKLNIVNLIVLQTFHRTITHSAIVIRKTTKKIEIMKTWEGGYKRNFEVGDRKKSFFLPANFHLRDVHILRRTQQPAKS